MRLAFIILFSLSFIPSLFGQNDKGNSKNISKYLNKYNQAMYYISNYYLDTVDFDKVIDKALKGAMSQLDPHSDYLTKEEVKSMEEALQSQYEGIGISFTVINDTLTIQSVINGGPSEKVGIKSGDKIVSVNGNSLSKKDLDYSNIQKLLRGKKGTKVEVGVVRKRVKDVIYFNVVRDKIPLQSVGAAFNPIDDVLYIKLESFAITSKKEIRNAFSKYSHSKGVIIDLRDNLGGYLFEAANIAEDFLLKDQLIVTAKGKNYTLLENYASGDGIYQSGPLVILVNENSASSSEILAGAIQDQDRGLIVGRRTFGKGLVQQTMSLGDGSQLKMTVAKYQTPSGRTIQSPYKEGEKEEYYKNFNDRFSRGESFSKDSIHFADSLKFKTLVKGRTVYGGGGIMPDIFIPIDTSYITPFYKDLVSYGVIEECANKVADLNRELYLECYPNSEVFIDGYSVESDTFDILFSLAKNKGIKIDPSHLEISKEHLKMYIKALIANSLYDRNAFYKIIYETDSEFAKALDVIVNWGEYSTLHLDCQK